VFWCERRGYLWVSTSEEIVCCQLQTLCLSENKNIKKIIPNTRKCCPWHTTNVGFSNFRGWRRISKIVLRAIIFAHNREKCPIIPRFLPETWDILERIIELLRIMMERGLFTIFLKIRAHPGKFLNKKADRWADEGRDAENNVRWGGACLRPIFSWSEEGKECRCPLNQTLRTRVHKKVAQLQLTLHDNFTSRFLTRKQQQKLSGHILARQIRIPGINSHAPNFLNFGSSGRTTNAGKRIFSSETAWQESLGYIQARWPVLTKPRIAVHHGIRRDIPTAIVATPLRLTIKATRSSSFIPQLVMHLTLSGQYVKSWCTSIFSLHLERFTNRSQNSTLLNSTQFSLSLRSPLSLDVCQMEWSSTSRTRNVSGWKSHVTSSDKGDWAERN